MGSEQNEGTSFPPSEPKLCANGCGFFGSASNMNLCSKCYWEIRVGEEQAVKAKAAMEKSLSVKRKQEDVIVETFKPVEELRPRVVGSTMAIGEQQQPQPQPDVLAADQEKAVPKVLAADQEQAVPKVANRCFICRKKVGLTGFRCRCESTFCSEHRYPEKHDCSFDYKGTGRNAIAKANPVVKADKVDRF